MIDVIQKKEFASKCDHKNYSTMSVLNHIPSL